MFYFIKMMNNYLLSIIITIKYIQSILASRFKHRQKNNTTFAFLDQPCLEHGLILLFNQWK